MRAAITAVGGYVPEKILTNHELEKMVDTSDEWIRTRTGIKERRIFSLRLNAIPTLADRGVTTANVRSVQDITYHGRETNKSC